MTWPTHREYSVTFAFITTMVLYHINLTEINYYLVLAIILLASKYGALFPDLDHTWKNVKEKTIPNKIINKLIHLTGGKHRSWQTHSIDIVIIFTILSYYIPNKLYEYEKISAVNKEVIVILLLGFSSGWISHIVSDMLTSAGVRLMCLSRFKIALVPKNIGGLKFNTGNEWEAYCFKMTKLMNILLGILCLVYPHLEFIKNFIINIGGI